MCRIGFQDLVWKWLVVFVILLRLDGFESDCPETKSQTITFWSQFEKVTVQKSITELWTLISNQMMSISFPIYSSIKLLIINMAYTCVESYPLS